MPDVIDDMDNLFRRAAENYPLNTNNPDWNKVQSALQSGIPSGDADENGDIGKKDRSRRFLYSLLILTVGLILLCIYMIKDHNHEKLQGTTPTDNANLSELKKPGDGKNLNRQKQTGTLSRSQNTFSDVSTPPNKKGDEVYNPLKPRSKPNHNYSLKKRMSITSNSAGTETINDDVPTAASGGQSEMRYESPRLPDQGNSSSTAITDTNTGSLTKRETAVVESDHPEGKDTSGNESTTSTKKEDVAKKRREPHVYAGIIGGPDISTVKLQRIMKSGFTAGVIAGYRINKKWSIESGLSLTRKYYYSEGKYFSTRKIRPPAWLKIENVDGYCSMLELPVNLKYDFKSKPKANWFAVAGFSSYFMRKESYGYRYYSYGQEMEKHISFKESTKFWASVLNLGVGYSRNMGKTGILRIEPYVKIPFKGVGIGSLPIASSGVYLGLIRKLF